MLRTAPLVALLLLSCNRADPQPPEPAEPALIEVNADRKDLLFRYASDAGFQSATLIEEIPEAARGAVQVLDLSQSPEARGASKFVQVFDLSKAPYQGRLVARKDLEATLARQAEEAIPDQKPVIMYSASWCGVCRKARAFLHENKVLFVEKDIEEDKAAGRELADKLKKAGQQGGGVPVFDVGGRLMNGFDGPRLLGMIREGA